MLDRFWRASKRQPCHNDERQVQPVIHLMLECVAMAAERDTQSKTYLVLSEPAISKGRDDRLSDEALIEVISEGDVMHISLEIKGTNVFPTEFSQSGEKAFSQLIQEVALALQSKLWKENIMCGVVTRNVWYLFKIKEKTVGDEIMLDIVESAFIELENNRVANPIFNMPSLQQCRLLLDYLVRYLCHKC